MIQTVLYPLDALVPDGCRTGCLAGGPPGTFRVDTYKQRGPDHAGHDEVAGALPCRCPILLHFASSGHHDCSPDSVQE